MFLPVTEVSIRTSTGYLQLPGQESHEFLDPFAQDPILISHAYDQ